MKPKFFLLLPGLFALSVAKAGTDPIPTAIPQTGKKNDIKGVVSHADNKKPLKDVNVTAYLVTKRETALVTGETGLYSFDELKPGTYKFVFEKVGFKKVTREKIIIKADEGFQLNVQMAESKEYNIFPSPLHFMDF